MDAVCVLSASATKNAGALIPMLTPGLPPWLVQTARLLGDSPLGETLHLGLQRPRKVCSAFPMFCFYPSSSG